MNRISNRASISEDDVLFSRGSRYLLCNCRAMAPKLHKDWVQLHGSYNHPDVLRVGLSHDTADDVCVYIYIYVYTCICISCTFLYLIPRVLVCKLVRDLYHQQYLHAGGIPMHRLALMFELLIWSVFQ